MLYYCALYEGIFNMIVGSQDEVFYLFGIKVTCCFLSL